MSHIKSTKDCKTNDSEPTSKRCVGGTAAFAFSKYKNSLQQAKAKIEAEKKALEKYEADLKGCQLYGENPSPAYSGYLLEKYTSYKDREPLDEVDCNAKLNKPNPEETFNAWCKKTQNIIVPLEMYTTDSYIKYLGEAPISNVNILCQLTILNNSIKELTEKLQLSTCKTTLATS